MTRTRQKTFFEFNDDTFRQRLPDVYPYDYLKEGRKFYFEICHIVAIEACYKHRSPHRFEVMLLTQTCDQILVLSYGSHLDIADFFPCPKQGDEVWAVFYFDNDQWVLNGIRPISEAQYVFDYLIKFGYLAQPLNHLKRLDPFDFPIDQMGRRVPLLKHAVENKVKWLIDALVNKKTLYQDLIKQHDLSFNLCHFIIENEHWDLFVFMIDTNPHAAHYFAKYKETLTVEIVDSKVTERFLKKVKSL